MEIKQISFEHLNLQVAEQKEHEFEHWVNKTAKLIKRPYFTTFKIIEKWPLEKIKRHYLNSTKHNGNMPEDIYWWWLRKKEM